MITLWPDWWQFLNESRQKDETKNVLIRQRIQTKLFIKYFSFDDGELNVFFWVKKQCFRGVLQTILTNKERIPRIREHNYTIFSVETVGSAGYTSNYWIVLLYQNAWRVRWKRLSLTFECNWSQAWRPLFTKFKSIWIKFRTIEEKTLLCCRHYFWLSCFARDSANFPRGSGSFTMCSLSDSW